MIVRGFIGQNEILFLDLLSHYPTRLDNPEVGGVARFPDFRTSYDLRDRQVGE